MKERFNVQSNKEEEMWPPKTDSLTDGSGFHVSFTVRFTMRK